MAQVFTTSLAVRIEVTLNFDLTSNTGVSFIIREPDGTKVTQTATVDDITKGIVYYITQTGELNKIGSYQLQPKVTFTGKTYFGTVVDFDVLPIIT